MRRRSERRRAPTNRHCPTITCFIGGGVVYDLVYNPPITRLIAAAERAGCRTIGGLDMLVAQAQAQFEWWTGGRPADRVMRDAAVGPLAMRGTETVEGKK
jgi:shikimate 5-dehydrogenase